MNKNKFYVTTPIYYVNSKPHLGTLYTTLLADITARWNKLQGKKVFFLTGTDEHGQKIETRAKDLSQSPKELADSMVSFFKNVWGNYEIAYSRFIRTTDDDHKKAVISWIKKLQDKRDIYKSHYSGWYCTPCETFVALPEKDDTCPSCHRKLQKISEESYFFRLSAYEDRLLNFYKENPNFVIPKERLNEVTSFVKSGLKDLSISRKTVKWGIHFPGDDDHTVYVWGDALNNYISAIGYGDESKKEEFDFWWPADLHILGKDILRFHAVYWPAFLMAADLPLPKKLLVHGFILVDDKKMSKSLGNVVEPNKLAELYGVEQIRYYLASYMSVNQDGHFSFEDLEKRISADLSNNLGNLLNRVLTLALNNNLSEVESPENVGQSLGECWENERSVVLREKCEEAFRGYWDEMNHCQYHAAISNLCKFLSLVNAYFHDLEPWKVVKENKKLFEEIISAVCHSLYFTAIMLWPVMPTKMEELLGCLGQKIDTNKNYDEELRKNIWSKKFVLKKLDEPLFPRPEEHSKEMESK